MNPTIVSALIGAIGLGFGSFLTYLATKGKATADAALVYSQAASLAVKTQNSLQEQLATMNNRLEERNKLVDTLTLQVLELKGEGSAKDRKIHSLEMTVLQQEHTIADLRKEVEALRTGAK